MENTNNRSVMLQTLEQQVRLLEEERDALCEHKAKLMVEVEEYREQVDQMAVMIKDSDKVKQDEFVELDDYVDQLEYNLEQQEKTIEAQDIFIGNQQKEIEELNEKVTRLTKQSRKQELLQIINPTELASKSAKRQKLDVPGDPTSTENKENLVQQLIRRSSCIFGFNKNGGQEAATPQMPQKAKMKQEKVGRGQLETVQASPCFGNSQD